MRVFLDTNVLVSAFLTRGVCADVLRYVLAKHVLITGEIVIDELQRVLRDKMRAPATGIAAVEKLLREHVVAPTPRQAADLPIKDMADRWIVACAIGSKAEVLVTGDGELLKIASRVPVRIMSPRAFWETVRASANEEP